VPHGRRDGWRPAGAGQRRVRDARGASAPASGSLLPAAPARRPPCPSN